MRLSRRHNIANKLLTFLGTGNYVEVYHKYNEVQSGPHVYIQESLMEIFCKEWNNEDSVVIIQTSASKEKNWHGENGLEKRLNNLKNTFNIQIDTLDIPEGKSENELWEMFEAVLSKIDEKDNIILDVTHSFRSLPILSLIILNYAKAVKQVKIEKIIYAVFETLGSQNEVKDMLLEKRVVPIFDLTPFVTLFDWTIAVNRFLETGNASKINELSSEKLKPILRESEGREGTRMQV